MDSGVERTARSGKAEKRGYSGIYNCHKYWGKKPAELYELILQKFAAHGDTIADPFLGSGVLASVAHKNNLRFLGCDLNPAAIDVARIFINPPTKKLVDDVIKQLSRACRASIDRSYTLHDERVVTHIIWSGETIDEAWEQQGRGTQAIEITQELYDQAASFRDYKPVHFRDRELQKNSRINVDQGQHVSDLFTGRALRNIDILLGAIADLPPEHRDVARFILSSSLGQMSKMVFAISGRGKTKSTTARTSKKFEVGSWVIGFWRPKQFFEINVWRVFEGRARRLLSAVTKEPAPRRSEESKVAIQCKDALTFLSEQATASIDLIVTDPPHSDRIPYLELSEMWNTFLGYASDFEKELIYSNSSVRKMTQESYRLQFDQVIAQASRTLKPGGHFILIFNTTDRDIWDSIKASTSKAGIDYKGRFSAEYSANSVVQDNRDGALKNDWCLVFRKKGEPSADAGNESLPAWTEQWA